MKIFFSSFSYYLWSITSFRHWIYKILYLFLSKKTFGMIWWFFFYPSRLKFWFCFNTPSVKICKVFSNVQYINSGNIYTYKNYKFCKYQVEKIMGKNKSCSKNKYQFKKNKQIFNHHHHQQPIMREKGILGFLLQNRLLFLDLKPFFKK